MRRIKKNSEEKEGILQRIIGILSENSNILFAYVFGSFLSNEGFKDIDIAIYLEKTERSTTLRKELDLEVKLGDALRIPVDVRILNEAPLFFRYNVLKSGRVILDRDLTRRSDFESLTCRMYFDFKKFQIEYFEGAKRVPF